MGKYDVKAEEDAIRRGARRPQARPRRRRPDRRRGETDAGDRRPAGSAVRPRGTSLPSRRRPVRSAPPTASTPTTSSFLRDALELAFETPGAAPAPSGVSWREHTDHAHRRVRAERGPAAAARRAAAVLPARAQGGRAAHAGDHPRTAASRRSTTRAAATSTSLWPEAHYLSPLHPAARLGGRPRAGSPRPQRGLRRRRRDRSRRSRCCCTGTLTNARGQVVASTYPRRPLPRPRRRRRSPSPQPFASAARGARCARLRRSPGQPRSARRTSATSTRTSRRRCEAARTTLGTVVASRLRRAEVDERVERWTERVRRLGATEAGELVQRLELRDRQLQVDRGAGDRALDASRPAQRCDRCCWSSRREGGG